MPTITDPEVYQTASTTGKVVKTMTIPGVSGKQIKVESESVSLANGKEGVRTDLMIYMKYGSTKFAVSGWGVTNADYTPKSYDTYAYIGDTGEDVILQWELKTANTKYAAKMKDASCVYSLVDVEGATEEPATEDESPTEETTTDEQNTEEVKKYIVVECKESEIDDITEAVKNVSASAEINKCDKVE